jgi:cholesterol transport system auxiliary component
VRERFTMSRVLRLSSAAAAGGLTLMVAACMSGPPSGGAPLARYDLGQPGDAIRDSQRDAAAALAQHLGTFKLLDVTAAPGLDSDQFVYRLAFDDARRLHVYGASRWSATPSQLLTQRLRSLLASRGGVLGGADALAAPLLKIELIDFEQVFDSPGASRGVVSLRATLTQKGALFAQRTFDAEAPSVSADAQGGAGALADAGDAALAQLLVWLAQQRVPEVAADAAARAPSPALAPVPAPAPAPVPVSAPARVPGPSSASR